MKRPSYRFRTISAGLVAGLSLSLAVPVITTAPVVLADSSQSFSSADIKLVQEALIKYGYTVVGGANGEFGPNTGRPLKVFQGHNGLQATGEMNTATVKLAKELLGVSSGDDNSTASSTTAASTDGATESTYAGVRLGSSGAKVKQVQSALIAAGYDVVGGADGIFGALTAAAVKKFQADKGLVVDGIVGPNTSKALAKLAAGGSGAQGASNSTSSNASTSTSLKGLAYGSVGDNVKKLQRALMDTGLTLRGGVDGVFGTATQSALKAFQKVNGLAQSGKVDAATAKALASLGGGSTSSNSSAASNQSIVGLKAGSLGSLVKQLQQALIDAGVNVRGGADGIFGPATDQALREFQRAQGLDATGVVNQATLNALSDPQQSAPTGGDTGFPMFGERGERVMKLQQALVNAGVPLRGGVDGEFGSGTAAAVMEFQRRNGFSVNGQVNAATAKALGLSAASKPAAAAAAPAVKLQAFPVQGWCGFANTWHADRSGGRLHVGTDIIAATGKLVYAVADGVIEKMYYDQPGGLTGNGVRLRLADGTYFFYAHLDGHAKGIKQGVKVKAGQVLGTIGSTGNAGTPHLHFEIHPGGGSAVNPYPYLKAIDGCART